MKLVFKYMLQIPLLTFLVIGVDSISDGNLWITVLCRQYGKDEPDASIRTEAFFRSGAGDTPPLV